ncbi:MAG: flavin-binding family monooxygenase [Myxococcaceae bacterium]|nr:flavin-binding family monooxygenase [Myxococcaceae bacterium]
MLQRSQTYVVSRPAEDSLANKLREHLPAMTAYGVTRWKNVLLGMAFYRLARDQPERMKKLVLRGVRARLGADYDIDTHFTPSYKPWDQRLCLVPDGDLFKALRHKRASVVTDHIETFTEKGIKLRSGAELEADLIVTATGLNLEVLGALELSVDGERVEPNTRMTYKGMMYSDVPNMAFAVGYTNASWTLKADLTSEYVCRLLNYMDATGMRKCAPRRDPQVSEAPFLDFTSGYVQRSMHKFPRQGDRAPWKLYQNYARDLLTLRYGSIDDGVMEFSQGSEPEGMRPRVARLLRTLRGALRGALNARA